MPDTGWISPSSVSTENNGSDSPSWSGTSNIYSDDNSYASVSGLYNGKKSDWLIADFLPTVPAYASNFRVAARVKHKRSSGSNHACRIADGFYWGYSLPGFFLIHDIEGQLMAQTGEGFSASEVAEVFGGENWGLGLSAAQINDDGFSVKLCVANGNSYNTTAYIDQIEVKIWYDDDVVPEDIEEDIAASASVSGNVVEVTVLEETINVVSVVEGKVYGDLVGAIAAVSTVSGDVSYYDPADQMTLDLSESIAAGSEVWGEIYDDWFNLDVWDNEDGMVKGRIELDIDEGVSVGGVSAGLLYRMLDYDGDHGLETSIGLESDYIEGEYGFFFPSSVPLFFQVSDLDHGDKIFRLFRDGVEGVDVIRSNDGRVLFKGVQDTKELEYDFQTGQMKATFVAYTDIDVPFKSGSNSIDEDFLDDVFDYDVAMTGNSFDGSQWMRVTYVFQKLLAYCGATEVEFGNFNRLFTSFVLETAEDTNNSWSAVGWQNDGTETFSEWLASTPANLLFDRLLVYKKMLFQTGNYNSVGADSLIDMLQNMAAWFSAVVGVDASGKGYVVPTYVQEGVESIDDEDVISCKIKSYLKHVAGVVGCGHVKTGALDPDPGMCFPVGVNFSYVWGWPRYDADATHNDYLYNHTALYEVNDNGDKVIKAFFPVPPYGGNIRSTGAQAFGYTAGSDLITHDDDLLAVQHVGSEEGWNVGGSKGYYIDGDKSYVMTVADKYYEFRGADREVFELELSLVDLEMVKLYKLASDSRYGANVLLRPILIQTNYTTGRTYMEAINVTRTY